jgi:hypothetical protein
MGANVRFRPIADEEGARHHPGMLATTLLLLFTPPPVPPPPASQHNAAIALWAENVTEHQKNDAVDFAVYAATWQALENSGLRIGQKRWTEKQNAMRSRIAKHVPKDRSEIDMKAFYCASDTVARNMSVEQIDAVRRFLSTSAGKSFWVLTKPEEERLKACYKEALSLEARAADYKAVGLKVPKHVRNRTIITVIQ